MNINFPMWVKTTKCKTHTHRTAIPTHGRQGCRIYHTIHSNRQKHTNCINQAVYAQLTVVR